MVPADLSGSSLDVSIDTTNGSVEISKISIEENEKVLTDSFIDRIILHYLLHNNTLVCLEGLMELLNENRELCDKLPTHKKQIMNLFREHRDLIEVIYFIKCNKCRKRVRVDSSTMEKVQCCGKDLKKTETNFFVYMPIKKQLTQSITNNWTYIKDFDTTSKDNSYSDAHDGEILKNILKHYEDEDLNILSLCLNIDGANKFKSNTHSLWPIQFIQNFLPPQIRYQSQNIIVSGLFYTDSDDKLNFREYLLPLIVELNQLKENNITMNIDNEQYMFKPLITHCAFDLPAKSKVQETKQFGGYHACTYCTIPGEKVLIKRSNDGDNKKKAKNKNTEKKPMKFIRYLEAAEDYPLRDDEETLTKMLTASSSTNKEAVDGIKDVSCLVALEHFDIVWSIGAEYMHLCLLGVQKRITDFFLNTKNKDSRYYITPRKRKLLNQRILAIKPNSDVVRKPRSLQHRANYKASEHRYMLLYYFPICLSGCVPKVYVDHVRLLSSAVYILLKSTITAEEVDKAEKMLNKFVKEHQLLFGKEAMVMVIHLLKHLAQCVRKLGPIWTFSAFPFERNNGVLLKRVNGTSDVLLQISSKYCLAKSLVKKREKTIIEKMFLGKSVNIVEELRILNIETLKELNFSNAEKCVYKRIKIGTIVYTSLLYTRPRKSIDYFIGLKNEMIGMAKFYIEYNHKICVVMEQFEIVDNVEHILKVQRANQNILAPIDDIQVKYIYMKIGLNQYVVSSPNPYEKE